MQEVLLEVVLKELRTTSTYKHVDRECMAVVTEHLKFMTKYKIYVDHDLRYLPSFYWLPKLHKQPYGTRFIAASNKCSTKPLSKLLTTCLSRSLVTSKNIVMEFTVKQELIVSG